jgi:hypothetical protein
MSGILLSNTRRRISATIGGKVVSSLESGPAIVGGKLLRISEGREGGSKTDGSAYVVAHVQVNPGTVIRVAGYGPDQVAQINAIQPDGTFSAFLSGMGRGGYKLVEFDKPADSQPAA